MLANEQLEKKLQQNQIKMRELSINLEKLDREYHQLMNQLGLEIEQVESFVKESSNFSQPIWERLQKEKKKLDEKLDLVVTNTKNLKDTEKSYEERGFVRPHWLFVR